LQVTHFAEPAIGALMMGFYDGLNTDAVAKEKPVSLTPPLVD
jgi:hypothetical protein